MKTKLQHFYLPILRYDEQQHRAYGMAYVNAVVDGEGGLDLTRAAMEEATEDFLAYGTGALREMHQPKAAGTVPLVEWRDGGCYIEADVVDEAAREKCRRGVYKGFSVGVRPTLMRGNQVLKCKWPEISLVDRPKDPDAVITLYRAEDLDAEAEIEVEEQAEELDISEAVAHDDAENADPQDAAAQTELAEEAVVLAAEAEAAQEEAERAETFTSGAVDLTSAEAAILSCFVDPADGQRVLEAFRLTVSEVARTLTEADVPERENLEGKPRLTGQMHYDCGAKTCHGHLQHAAAQRCSEASTNRAEQTPAEELDELIRTLYVEGEDVCAVVNPGPARALRMRSLWEQVQETLPRLEVERLEETPPEPSLETEAAPSLERFEALSIENASLLQRLAEGNTKITRLEAEVQRLGSYPDTRQERPRVFGAATRQFSSAHREANPEIARMLSEYQTLTASLQGEPDDRKRNDGVARILELRGCLVQLGADPDQLLSRPG
jgi:hypothetical protein